jgi:imidazolonepropionase
MIITNISEIYGTGLRNAWLRIDPASGRFTGCGEMHAFPHPADGEELIDAAHGMVLPSYCDSHTHIVYAGQRDGEFLDKINGLSYEQIAANGGGILNSADRLHNTSEDDLFAQSMERANEVMRTGTGCIEIKSGYGPPCPTNSKCCA